MKNRRVARQRRAAKTRRKIDELQVPRLCVHRSAQHIYAQLIAPEGDKVIASASTLDKDLRKNVSYGGNVKAATAVGELIATRSKDAGIKQVAFDRSGFKYHGRVKALADAARANGLEF